MKLTFIRVIQEPPVFQGNATDAGPGIRILRVQSWLNPSRRGRSFQAWHQKRKGEAFLRLNPSRQGRSFQGRNNALPENCVRSLNPSRQGRSFQDEADTGKEYIPLVSTPPGKGGHFKPLLYSIYPTLKSQPLPAREVISRASILAL